MPSKKFLVLQDILWKILRNIVWASLILSFVGPVHVVEREGKTWPPREEVTEREEAV